MRNQQENICWENASKTIKEFVPAVSAENYGNYTAGDVVAQIVDTLLTIFRAGG
jgi:hypothetical protein